MFGFILAFSLLLLPQFRTVWGSPLSATPRSEEITLYDANGVPTAYIAPDEELTIYLWEGKPVAYLVPTGSAFSIYGFNGTHLGWFEGGIVRDHDGHAVGFIKGAVAMLTSLAPLKSLKELKPLKSLKELAPLKPVYSRQFSSIPLSLFLAAGAD